VTTPTLRAQIATVRANATLVAESDDSREDPTT
jgi:hypothetical protein